MTSHLLLIYFPLTSLLQFLYCGDLLVVKVYSSTTLLLLTYYSPTSRPLLIVYLSAPHLLPTYLSSTTHRLYISTLSATQLLLLYDSRTADLICDAFWKLHLPLICYPSSSLIYASCTLWVILRRYSSLLLYFSSTTDLPIYRSTAQLPASYFSPSAGLPFSFFSSTAHLRLIFYSYATDPLFA